MQSARRLDYRDTSSHRVGPSAALTRERPMVRRSSDNSGEAAYQRLARRTEEAQAAANERVEALFDNMLGEVRELRRDVQGLAQDQGAVARRMDDLEVQINMTRDEVQKRALVPAPSQVASAKQAISDTVKSPWARGIAFCVGLLTVFSVLNNLPDMARGAERFWMFITGREIDAIEVIVPTADGGPVPKK